MNLQVTLAFHPVFMQTAQTGKIAMFARGLRGCTTGLCSAHH